MENGSMLSSTETIKYLSVISQTPQDEEIEKMLNYYCVYGILELSTEQIIAYVKMRKAELNSK